MTFTSSIRRRKSVSSSGSGRTGPARGSRRVPRRRGGAGNPLRARPHQRHIDVRQQQRQRLIGISDQLDHGVWTNNNMPPSRIEAGETVSWESESDGIATGTEGEVQYQIEGTSITMNLHWDDPFVGANSFDITSLDRRRLPHHRQRRTRRQRLGQLLDRHQRQLRRRHPRRLEDRRHPRRRRGAELRAPRRDRRPPRPVRRGGLDDGLQSSCRCRASRRRATLSGRRSSSPPRGRTA